MRIQNEMGSGNERINKIFAASLERYRLERLLVVQVDMPRPSLVREARTIIAIASLL